MEYESWIGFSFQLPDGWRHDDDPNRTLSFYGPNGRAGLTTEVIQLELGGISPRFVDPANREAFLAEPGSAVERSTLGEETNVVTLRRQQYSEISAVRDGFQYVVKHGHDVATFGAVATLRRTFVFPTRDEAREAIARLSAPDQQAISRVLNAKSPEEARAILAQVGATTVRTADGTLHRLPDRQATHRLSERKWWQFWK
ncbi:MAG: hypothetical protein ACKVZ0_12270 [Gemmatimonadales bacterium]